MNLKQILNKINAIYRKNRSEKIILKDNPMENVVVITLDSLRYDTAIEASTPNIDRLISDNKAGHWYKVYSPGTYTLPSHISIFHAGILPTNICEDVPEPYNRKKKDFFRAKLPWNRNAPAYFPTPAAPNIVKGFEKLGYRTLGVGGVGWFNNTLETGKFWGKHYFREFFWDKKFMERADRNFENQIELISNLKLSIPQKPLLLFLNISSTHTPYMNFGISHEGQKKSLEYVDKFIPELIEMLPKKCHILLMSDHGDCFGEDGLWGHGFYHPKVMEVPFVYIKKGV